MSRFTSEDLMKAMGLQVGDRVQWVNNDRKTICEIKQNDIDMIYLENINDADDEYRIGDLVDLDFKVLPKPKRVGDTLCQDIKCEKCPLRMVRGCENISSEYTLYQFLEEIKKYNDDDGLFDQEIYDLLKTRLDKEVKDYE